MMAGSSLTVHNEDKAWLLLWKESVSHHHRHPRAKLLRVGIANVGPMIVPTAATTAAAAATTTTAVEVEMVPRNDFFLYLFYHCCSRTVGVHAMVKCVLVLLVAMVHTMRLVSIAVRGEHEHTP